jgi:sugar phosphate isomerase/epimerase
VPLKDPLSFQLYSIRNFPPLDHQLAVVAKAGFTNVETWGPYHDDPATVRALLDRHGLQARSGHFGLGEVTTERDKVRDVAATIGMDVVVAPYLGPDERPADAGGWRAIGDRLAEAAGWYAGQGLRLAWHNHDFEFVPLPDGTIPLEHLLQPGVLWEADVAWIVRGGADPRPWLGRYPGRVPLVHVKDIAAPGADTNEDGWADVGAGTVPWGELWGLAVKAGAEAMIAEHDNPSSDERFANASAAAMRALAKGGR